MMARGLGLLEKPTPRSRWETGIQVTFLPPARVGLALPLKNNHTYGPPDGNPLHSRRQTGVFRTTPDTSRGRRFQAWSYRPDTSQGDPDPRKSRSDRNPKTNRRHTDNRMGRRQRRSR